MIHRHRPQSDSGAFLSSHSLTQLFQAERPGKVLMAGTTKDSRPKNTDVSKLLTLKKQNPTLSNRNIAKLAGITHTAVNRMLSRYGITKQHMDDFKTHRADILAGMQERIVQSVSSEDIEKASLRDKVIAAGVLFDKERLERGQSTVNLAAVFAKAMEE